MVGTLASMPRPKNPEKSTSIRVSEAAARMVEVIAMADNETASSLVSPLIIEHLKQRYFEALKKLNQEPKDLGLK